MENEARAMEFSDISDTAGASTSAQANWQMDVDNDMAQALREFCRINQHPAPVIEILQQSGTAELTEYTAKCEVARYKGIATAYDKRVAKANAAQQVLRIMRGNLMATARPKTTRMAPKPGRTIFYEESDRRPTSTRFREEYLLDRRAYFQTYYDDLKQNALHVLYSNKYKNSYERAMAVFRALRLTPSRSLAESDVNSRAPPMIMLEVECDFDCLFMNYEERIYDDVVAYFKDCLE